MIKSFTNFILENSEVEFDYKIHGNYNEYIKKKTKESYLRITDLLVLLVDKHSYGVIDVVNRKLKGKEFGNNLYVFNSIKSRFDSDQWVVSYYIKNSPHFLNTHTFDELSLEFIESIYNFILFELSNISKIMKKINQ